MERDSAAGQEVFVRDALPDDPPHVGPGRLGGDGQAAVALGGKLLADLGQVLIHAQTRHGNHHVLRVHFRPKLRGELLEPRVIARRKGKERNLAVPRVLDRRTGRVHDRLGPTRAHRPANRIALAEPASPRAAAHDFQRDAVLNRLHVRNDRLFRERDRVELLHTRLLDHRRDLVRLGERDFQAVFDPRFVAVRDVNPREFLRQSAQILAAGRARFGLKFKPRFGKGQVGLLAVAHDERVDEVADRLGILHARPARDHQRGLFRALPPEDRDPPEVQNRQDVRVRQLVLERKPHHVEIAQRGGGFQTAERKIVFGQKLFHVPQRREDPLAVPLRVIINHRVKDLDPVAAHPDRVRVRETEAEAPTDRLRVFHDHIQLTPDVLAGGLNQREYFVTEKFVVIHRNSELNAETRSRSFEARLTFRPGSCTPVSAFRRRGSSACGA